MAEWERSLAAAIGDDAALAMPVPAPHMVAAAPSQPLMTAMDPSHAVLQHTVLAPLPALPSPLPPMPPVPPVMPAPPGVGMGMMGGTNVSAVVMAPVSAPAPHHAMPVVARVEGFSNDTSCCGSASGVMHAQGSVMGDSGMLTGMPMPGPLPPGTSTALVTSAGGSCNELIPHPKTGKLVPVKKEGAKRQSFTVSFQLQVVREALQRPSNCRIKPTCREYPMLEPKQLRRWIRNLDALEHAEPTAKHLFTQKRHKALPSPGGINQAAVEALPTGIAAPTGVGAPLGLTGQPTALPATLPTIPAVAPMPVPPMPIPVGGGAPGLAPFAPPPNPTPRYAPSTANAPSNAASSDAAPYAGHPWAGSLAVAPGAGADPRAHPDAHPDAQYARNAKPPPNLTPTIDPPHSHNGK